MNSQTDLPSAPKTKLLSFGQRDELDLFVLLRTIWRGRVWVALCMLACFVVGGYYAYRVAQPAFTASAVVEFTPRESPLLDLEAVVTGTSVDYVTLNTEIAKIESHEMAEMVVARLNLAQDPMFTTPPVQTWKDNLKELLGMPVANLPSTDEQIEQWARRRAINWVQSSVNATEVIDTYLLRITANASRPTVAAQLANTVAEVYVQSQLDAKYVETEQAIDWLSDRARKLEADLRERETEITSLQSATDLINREALQAVQIQAKEFRDRLESRQDALVTVRIQSDAQDAALASLSKSQILAAFDDQFLIRAGSRLDESLEGDNGDREAFLERARTLADATRLSRTRIQNEIDALSQSLTGLESRIDVQSSDLQMIEQMQRELAVSRDLYQTFLTGLQEATVQVGLVRSDSRVMSRALVPQLADSPRKRLILGASLLVGFVIGLAFLLVREFLNNRIQNMTDLENLTGLPVLGSVPAFPIRKRRRRELLNFLVSNPTSPEIESLRNLRTSILMRNLAEAPKVIMITSSIPGEGKTSLSLSLAFNLSGLGKRVLLIEGDIRRRTLNNYLDISDDTRGLLDVVTGTVSLDEAVVTEPTTGINVLIGQKSDVNPADLFSSPAFKNLLNALRTEYDHIIIDTPPVLVVPDARIIASLADSVLYAVKWDSTSREQVLNGVRLFEAFGQTITGFAITQVNAKRIRKYGYGDQYGAYSRYGKAYYDR
ncbi:GumC family protein [Thetidibacter halocola]|uniref:non-specific protein-tyrosine kinase n=1 Tax=Thetidibacter halocola TaxID=2827239 RepID=A0A8J8B8W3_9RHOB|nr:polysaccharide biosynthesis tyrosine autokinase [Thetidibacter halocola]MBS0124935.1 polysaccharide biosynthesis tyrosine autokinase [Thetidibacter halocola]